MLNIASESVALMLRLLVESTVVEQGLTTTNYQNLPVLESSACNMEELDGRFYIQTFSSTSRATSMDFAQNLKGNVVTYLSGNGNYIVLIGPYASYNGAHNELPYQLKSHGLSDDSFITQLSNHQVLKFLC